MVTFRVGTLLLLLVSGCEKSTAGPSTPPPDAVKPSAVASAPATATTGLSPTSPELWVGTYTGTWTAGTATVSYVAKVKKAGEGYLVDVEADGTQTMTRIAAEGRMPPPGSGEGAVMSVHFVACKPDDMFKCKGHAKGDRLFRIRIVPDAYLLAFDKMTAPDDKTKEIPLQKK